MHSLLPTTLRRRVRDMRVLFVHQSADMYGSDVTVAQAAAGLRARGVHAVVALPVNGPLSDRLRAAAVPTFIVPQPVLARQMLNGDGLSGLVTTCARGLAALARLVLRERISLVHTNTLAAVGGALIGAALPVAHVWHVHEIIEKPWLVGAAMPWTAAALADRIVCNSQATARWLGRSCPPVSGKTDVVYNALDEQRIATAATGQRLRRRLQLEGRTPLVGLIGRIHWWKGQHLFVDAVKQLRARHPKARFVIVGDPPPGQDFRREELRRRIRDEGLDDAVRLLGHVDDISDVYAACDVAVIASTEPEPFGLVAVEAMALGRPVIAPRHGGVAEVVEHEVSGLLFQPRDARALADALGRLLSDPDLRRRMGAAARVRQQSHFSEDRYVDGLLSVYRAAM